MVRPLQQLHLPYFSFTSNAASQVHLVDGTVLPARCVVAGIGEISFVVFGIGNEQLLTTVTYITIVASNSVSP